MKRIILAFLFSSMLILEQKSFGVEDWPSATDDGPPFPPAVNCNVNNQGMQCGTQIIAGQRHCFSCPANSRCWPKVPASTGWDCVGNCRGANTIQCGVTNDTNNPVCCSPPLGHCTANPTNTPPSASCGTGAGGGPTCTGGPPNCRTSCAAPLYFCGNPGKAMVDNMCCTQNDVCTQNVPSSVPGSPKFLCLNNLNPGGQPTTTCGGPSKPLLSPGNVCCIIPGQSFWQCPTIMGCSSPLKFNVCGVGTAPFPPQMVQCVSGVIIYSCPPGNICVNNNGISSCLDPSLLRPTGLPVSPGGPQGLGIP